MLKVGLIGCGYMGTMHANCYMALKDKVQLSAVADIRAEKAEEVAKLSDAEIYKSAEELINNSDVDFVDICLPTYLHERYAVMAMKKGFNVFVEKPLCRDKEEAERLIECQKETGKTVQVGQVIRFWDEYVWLKKAKEENRFGKLISANLKRVSPRPEWAWENWLHNPELSGGMALDMHIHDLDYMRYLMGEPKKIKVSGLEMDGLTEYIMTSYIYDDSVLIAECAWNYPKDFPFSMAYRVKFEKATVCFDTSLNTFIVYPNDGEPFTPEIEKRFEGMAGSGNISSLGGYYNELEYFINMLENPDLDNIASLSEGARSVELALEGILMIKE